MNTLSAALAYATNGRNLNTDAAYPNVEAVGSGTLVQRRASDGKWYLPGTTLVLS